jgi:Sec-independent protein translocase protein TatA
MNLIPLRWLIVLLVVALVMTSARLEVRVAAAQSTSKAKQAQAKADAAKAKAAAQAKSEPGKADKAEPAKVQPPEPLATWTIEGYGKTVDECRVYAQKTTLVKKLEAYFTGLNPPLLFRPSAELVMQRFPLGEATKCSEGEEIEIAGEKAQCWAWTVKLTAADVEFFRQEDTRYRVALARADRAVVSEARMEVLAKLMVVMVTGLAGLWGFLRFDEWVFGSRRNRMRLAVVGVLVTGGLSWWLLS